MTRSVSTRNSVRSPIYQAPRGSRKVWTSRLVFLLSLAVVGALLSYGAYHVLTESEQNLAENQFDAISDRALDAALEITLRKRLGAKALATTVAHAFPNASQWPYVHLPGFADIASAIIETVSAGTMGLAPLVKPEQLDALTDFIHDAAFSENEPPKDYQLHVTGFDESNGFTRYNETTGETIGWESNSTNLWPFTMHSLSKDLLLYNLHSIERFGAPIDDMEACAATRHEVNPNNQNTTLNLTHCATMSDIVVSFRSDGSPRGPSAFIYQPIYPANNPSVLTGFISSGLDWNRVLENLFSAEVSGVDCVLATETTLFTYHIKNGIAFEGGYGDLHERAFEKHGKSIHLYDPGFFFSHRSATYTLTVYPSEELFDVYSTQNPIIALIGAFAIVFFTTVLYLLYDYFVRQEFHHKALVLKAKREYMRFISHEVRTPLNAIVLGSHLVQDDMLRCISSSGNDGEQTVLLAKEMMQNKLADWSNLTSDILTNAQSAVHVLNDLLNYDKVESDTLHLELTCVPIWSLIQRTMDEFQMPARAKNITFGLECDDSNSNAKALNERTPDAESGTIFGGRFPAEAKDHWVIGDAVRLPQVLRNFFSNAIKFTPEQGKVSVRVCYKPHYDNKAAPMHEFTLCRGERIAAAPRGHLQVDVTDSGAGMTEEQLARVFNDGVQFNVNELQAGQGSGLGLYIAHNIAAQHEGNLTVSSRGLGHGTTFTLTLPMYHVPDEDLPVSVLRASQPDSNTAAVQPGGKSSLQSATSSGPALEKYRILVVDDALVNRKLLIRLLRDRGHVCDEADDGDIALLAIRRAMESGERYDTILLDYQMPRMKGPDAAREARKLGCDSIIIGITGNMLPEDIQYFKEQGANAVLPKPLDLDELEDLWAFGV